MFISVSFDEDSQGSMYEWMYDLLRKTQENFGGWYHQNHLSSTSRTHMVGCPNSQAKGKQNFTSNTAIWVFDYPKNKK